MTPKEPFVITISREVGSGGRTVGGILARKLDARYCDKQLLDSLKKQFDLSANAIENLKGQKKNWRISSCPTSRAPRSSNPRPGSSNSSMGNNLLPVTFSSMRYALLRYSDGGCDAHRGEKLPSEHHHHALKAL